jgi:phosphoribosylanthranilate isomerase
MKRIRLKICGLRTLENIRDVLRYEPDFTGFIFYAQSPRFVKGPYQWIGKLDTGPSVRKVGVFVNDTIENMLKITKEADIEVVQLHGQESRETCMALKQKGLHVIKVFSVGDHFSFEEMRDFPGAVDFFMFDTCGKYLGGNGIPFDWSLLENYPYQVPFFLSGGIGLDNIGHVKFLNHPMLYAVDVNSRLESGPGIKDIGLLGKFIKEFEKLNHD